MKLDIEKQNFIKLFRLTIEGGAISLRGLLRLEAKLGNPPSSSTQGIDDVYVYIQGHNQDMNKLPEHIFVKISNYISEKVPVDKWEIACLYNLLKKFFKKYIDLRGLAEDVKTIYDERNTLSHAGELVISSDNFALRWSEISRAILNICRDLDSRGSTNNEKEMIESLLKELTEGNYDATASLKSVQEIAELKKTLEFFEDDLKAAIEKEWSTEEIEYRKRRREEGIRKLKDAICPENKKLLAKQAMDFELGIHLEIGCDDPEVTRIATELIGEMFKPPSATDIYRPTFTSFRAFGNFQQYIDSMYRTKKVNVKEGSVILVLKCKALRSLSDVIASVDDEDLLEHLQEISKVVSDQLHKDITISVELHEDTVKKTLDEIEHAKSSDFTQPKPMNMSSEEIYKCNVHPGKEIQYYCESDEVLLCDECISSNHETCAKSSLDTKLASIDGNIENALIKIKEKTAQFQDLTKESDGCFNEVVELEKKNNEYLAQMTKDFEEKLNKTKKEFKTRLRNEKIKLNDKMDKKDDCELELQKHEKILEQMKYSPDKRIIFISEQKVKDISQKGDKIMNDLREIKKNKDMVAFPEYKDAEDLTEIIGKAEEISAVAIGKRSLYNVSAEVDQRIIKKEKWITGLAFLGNGKLVIANAQKPELLVFDEGFKEIAIIEPSSEPWDVSPLTYDEIFVTLPTEKKLARYNVSDPVKKLAEIPVNYSCYGVCVVSDAIYVTSHEQGRDENANILVLSRDEQTQIHVFQTGNVTLKWPRCVRINNDKTQLFVSDWKTDCVHCFSVSDERVLFSYTNKEINRPMGLYVDENGHIIVCCGRTNSLYIINKNGKKGKRINVPELVCPSSITYRNKGGKLVIGIWDAISSCIVYKTK